MCLKKHFNSTICHENHIYNYYYKNKMYKLLFVHFKCKYSLIYILQSFRVLKHHLTCISIMLVCKRLKFVVPLNLHLKECSDTWWLYCNCTAIFTLKTTLIIFPSSDTKFQLYINLIIFFIYKYFLLLNCKQYCQSINIHNIMSAKNT